MQQLEQRSQKEVELHTDCGEHIFIFVGHFKTSCVQFIMLKSYT